MLFRLVIDAHAGPFSQFLPTLGFYKKQERVEYQKAVSELPSDEGSPLIWKTAEELAWRDEQISEVLGRMSVGDPDHEANDDPLLYIQDFLSDPELSCGFSCIHFGFLEGTLAAMSVVQINSKTGWSRISYMGMLPKFRARGLGVFVHRFGFAQMKREGGRLYHGGTVSTNAPMIRLFEASGCTLLRRMEEWVYLTKRGADAAK